MSDRRTSDATLIAALRILVRDIQSQDGAANACIAEAAERMEELVEERRWVPVGERLPEIDVPVWVRAVRRGDYGYTENEVCMTVAKLGRHYSEPTPTWRETVPAARHSMGITVTHWMPLPPGPEGDGNG